MTDSVRKEVQGEKCVCCLVRHCWAKCSYGVRFNDRFMPRAHPAAGSRHRPPHSGCGRRPCHTTAWESLLAQRYVPRTLYITRTREPLELSERYGCAASRLYGGLLYAFWSRRSRLASARGGRRGVPRLHRIPSAALETLYRTGSAHGMCRHHQAMVSHSIASAKIGRKVTQQGQKVLPTIIAPRFIMLPPVSAPPPSLGARRSSPWPGTDRQQWRALHGDRQVILLDICIRFSLSWPEGQADVVVDPPVRGQRYGSVHQYRVRVRRHAPPRTDVQ